LQDNKREKGGRCENLAVEFLKSKGYEIIERNYHYSNRGEIDIIAKDPADNYTAFIEVKSKENLNYGLPEMAISKGKMKQVRKVAELYLYEKEILELDCRFDIITVLDLPGKEPVINHYENAFGY
jgi:putative endonuclease